MKLSGKIALVATGALFFFAFFFSGWMIFRYQEMMIQQAKTYEAQDLKERTNRFMREVKRWDGKERQRQRGSFSVPALPEETVPAVCMRTDRRFII